MSVPLASLLELAVETAQAAGALARRLREESSIAVAATKSSPTDVVTESDRASERLIHARIGAIRPDDGFLGEEGASSAGTSGIRWVVDPIDGTVNYLYGIPAWAVSIAAEVDGEVAVGVVHNPVSGETWSASRGAGATVSDRLGERSVRVSTQHGASGALVGTGFGYDARVRARQGAAVAALLPQVRDIRRIGSAALDLCAVASGRLDAYAEHGLQPWDLAAGGLIAAEAGARVAGLAGRPASHHLVVAANPRLFGALEPLLEDAGFGSLG
ncbi:MAG TPA: inositol monophosphatase family protein [Nocardioidaceae bacterium]|nr:inositol monophosphatase family protein [Nocardioidaceae bacterium]